MKLRPSLVRRLIYPLQEAALRRPTFVYLRDLMQTQHLSREAVESFQMRKARQLLHVAENHCPWHAERIRAAGLDLSGDAQFTLEDVRRLPLMTKADARLNGEQMVWRDVQGGAQPYNTGGSSGEPLMFFFGRWRQASDAAGRMRARQWWGVNVGDPEVYVWGAPVELNKTDRIKTLRDRALNQLVLNAFEMSPGNMDAYLAAIRRFRPRCIYGYASSIALLAAHARERGRELRLPELRVVCTTGEPLYPHQRQLIGDVFGAPVANEFGSRDIGFTAHEHPSGEMLLMSESIILEVLDSAGNEVAPGEVGEAVLTGLCSEAQPFIRYRTGDLVRRAANASCSGLGLHVVGEVFGRTTDFITRADGTVMHALAVIYVVRAIPGVAEFKLVQNSVREIEVRVVPDSRWSMDGNRAVVEGLKRRLGDDVRVVVRKVEAIAPEASGKHRYVMSHVPLQEGLKAAGGGAA